MISLQQTSNRDCVPVKEWGSCTFEGLHWRISLMNPSTSSYSHMQFALSDLLETLMADFALRTPCWATSLIHKLSAKLKCFDKAPVRCTDLRTVLDSLSVCQEAKHSFGLHLLNPDLQEHTVTVNFYICRNKLLILRQNPEKVKSGAGMLHSIFLHQIKTFIFNKTRLQKCHR